MEETSDCKPNLTLSDRNNAQVVAVDHSVFRSRQRRRRQKNSSSQALAPDKESKIISNVIILQTVT